MKMKIAIAALLLTPTFAFSADSKPAPPSAPTTAVPATEDALLVQKKILRKLEDIEVRLERIEAAQKTAAASARKLEDIERDVRDIRRDTSRIK